MPNKLILSFSAALVALTTLAAYPARAQESDQVGRAIAGAVTLFIIGHALSDLTDDKKAKAAPSRNANIGSAPAYRFRQGQSYGNTKNGRWGRHPHKVLPMACFFTVNRGRERVGVFGNTCLSEFLKKPEWLPRECRMSIPVRHGRPATVYSATCLREQGYRAEGREARRRR